MDETTCEHCGEIYNLKNLECDRSDKGYWCDSCDGFNYFDTSVGKHQFTLLMENKEMQQGNKTNKIKPNIQFNKRLSLLRYPGGKSKVIDELYNYINPNKTDLLVSPFTGGGSFELAMLEAGVVKKVHLNDLDVGVYSLWWMIKHMPYELIYRIESVQPQKRDFFHAREVIKNDYKGLNMLDAAWSLLLVNRLAYSGIYKANPLGGRSGTQQQLLSRWNPVDLVRKIENIHSMADSIEVSNDNAFELIEEAYWNESSTIFADPPYVKAGESLYHKFFKKEDHIQLSVLFDSLHHGFRGADILLTYDYSQWLEKLYEKPLAVSVNRYYSIIHS